MIYPDQPEKFEAARDRLIVNDDVFDWNDLPDSAAVFGAGVIALGQALHRLSLSSLYAVSIAVRELRCFSLSGRAAAVVTRRWRSAFFLELDGFCRINIGYLF